jgi:hypothetical protein
VLGSAGLADGLRLVVAAAGLALALAGVVLVVAIWAAARDLRTGLAVLLDLLLAAGLLRLGLLRTWQDLAGAAALVAVRRLVAFGLRQRPQPAVGGRPGRGSRPARP